MQVVFILKCVLAIGSSRLGVLLGGPPLSLFDMLLATRRGFENLMFPLWSTKLGGSFVFLDACPSILFLGFPLLWVFWFILWLVGFHH